MRISRKIKSRLAAVAMAAALCMGSLMVSPAQAQASEWNNAYDYYQRHGNAVTFNPSGTTGTIYYGTRAKKATTSTKFQTIGWRVTVKNSSGSTLQTIDLSLGGSMGCISTVTKDGYEYNLYSMGLSVLTGSMSPQAKNALDSGKCTLTLDARMIVTTDGKQVGGIYTTYSGIANAANWSSDAKSSLSSYFGKSITGLFFTVTLKAGKGIGSVSGSGTYLYGTSVTATATVKTGYNFSGWSGDYTSSKVSCAFNVTKATTMTASATGVTLKIVYHRNKNSSDTKTASQTLTYGTTGNRLYSQNWTKNGCTQLGWSLSKGSKTAEYAINAAVFNDWLIQHTPTVDLYAVWSEKANSGNTDDTGGDDPPGNSGDDTQGGGTGTTGGGTSSDSGKNGNGSSTSNPDTPGDAGTQSDLDEDDDGSTTSSDDQDDLDEGVVTPEITRRVFTIQKACNTRFISGDYLGKSASEGGLPSSSRWLTDSTLYALLRNALSKSS